MAGDNYNQIFENLVEDEANLIGLIAYGLYKQEKRKEVIKITEKSGKKPTKSQIKSIESVLSNQLETFNDQANELLDVTFEYLIKENKEKIYYEHFRKEDIQKISQSQSFLSKLGQNILFRFIWFLIVGVVSYSIYVNSESLKLVGKKINETFKTVK